jgi:hypothetical protein
LTREELLARLRAGEDTLTELKASPQESVVRRALVAFANSATPERSGVLFLGASADGTPVGLTNPTSVGEKVATWAGECYPRVAFECVTLPADGGEVLAVIVPASAERPHFAAPAYVRDGPRTVKAPPGVYEDLIASRNTTAGAILRHKGEIVSVVEQERWAGGGISPASVTERAVRECRIEGCSAHSVELLDIASSTLYSFSLERVMVMVDTVHHRPLKLTIRPA